MILYRNSIEHINLTERGLRSVNNAVLSKEMLSDDSVTLKVNSNSVLDIKVNDYFEVFGQNYRINQLPEVNKKDNSSYEYTFIGQGLMYDLNRVKFFNADSLGFKTDLDFQLIGNLEFYLTTIKNNMDRFSINWDYEVPINNETLTLNFSSDNCLSALQKICQAFKTDFWVKKELTKFKIFTGTFGNVLPIPLEYGKGKGLYSLSRKNVNDEGVINRMYVSGGTENLPNGYRDYSNALKLPLVEYLEDAVLIAENGLKEGEIKLDEIYPKRVGIVTSLGSTKCKFIDNTMDFDLNEKEIDGITTKYLKPDSTAKIHFNTGNLAGYEFELKKGGYDTLTKEFEIIPFKTDENLTIPNNDSGAFQFYVNDEYVLLDIYPPLTYVTNAENELLAKANEQFILKKQNQVSYDLNVSSDFIQNLPNNLDIGDFVNVKDTDLGIDKVIRINSIQRNFIQNGEYLPFDYKIVIADTYEISFSSKLVLDIIDVKNVTIDQKGDIKNAKSNAQNAKETAQRVANLTDFLSTTIDGNAIATGVLIVGDVDGANAGISGITDKPLGNSVRFYAGSDYAGKNTANWLMKDNGMEEQWLGSIMIRRRGVVGSNYYDEYYNLNGQLAKRTAIIDGKITEEWYNNGILVYQVGQNGIYYVSEIPESYTALFLYDFGNNTDTPNYNTFDSTIIANWVKTTDPTRYTLNSNKTAYLYSAGQNVYSESNKIYEGAKNSQSKTDNITDGWYADSGVYDPFDELGDNVYKVTIKYYRYNSSDLVTTVTRKITVTL